MKVRPESESLPPTEQGKRPYLLAWALSLASFIPGTAQAQSKPENESDSKTSGAPLVPGAEAGDAKESPLNLEFVLQDTPFELEHGIAGTFPKTEPENLNDRDLSNNADEFEIDLVNADFPSAILSAEKPAKDKQKLDDKDLPHGATERSPFGIGWMGDSLAFGIAVAIDAMALMYTRSRRLLLGQQERENENDLRKKIAILHVVSPMLPFAAGFLAADALIAGGGVVGKAAVAGLYLAAGAVMYAFANNVLKEEAGLENETENKGLLSKVEGGVERFGSWLINKMPSATWALAMGVTVDAVISGLKFVQSSGWSNLEVLGSCLIAGSVVYGLITAAQKAGAAQISRLFKRSDFDPEKHTDRVAGTLSNATAAGFFAFRYFAWTGFLSSALIATGQSVNEWGLRGAALALSIGHGWGAVKKVWSKLRAAKKEDAMQFVGLAPVEELS